MKRQKLALYLVAASALTGFATVGDSQAQQATQSDKRTDKGAIQRAEKNQLPATGEPGRVDSPPIHGWHPIKRALQPVVTLEKNGVHLQQELGKMVGPIKDLHPPMKRLEGKSADVSDSMAKMQNQMGDVTDQMQGVRSDLSKLKNDVKDIKGPMVSVIQPLNDIMGPIEGVKKQLNMVLMAIIFAGFVICLGTPLTAIIVYKFRDHLFPASVARAAEKEVEKSDVDDDDDLKADEQKKVADAESKSEPATTGV